MVTKKTVNWEYENNAVTGRICKCRSIDGPIYFPAGRYAVEPDPWVYAKQVSVQFINIDLEEGLEEEIIDLAGMKN